MCILLDDYHGINGNVSLDRRSEWVTSPNRYDLSGSMGSSGNSTLSRDNGTYDINQAERNAKNNQENYVNNNNNHSITSNGNGSLESQDGMDTARKKVGWIKIKYYLENKIVSVLFL